MPLKGKRYRSTSHHMPTAGGGSVRSHSSTSTEYSGARKTTHQKHQQTIQTNTGDVYRDTSGSSITSLNPAGVAVGAAKGAAQAESDAVNAPTQFIGSHSHEGVLLFSVLLLVFSTWNGFFRPTINTIWTGAKWSTPIDGKLILGGIVFCIVLAMIADSSDQAASVIIVMLIGMWLLFIMFNGQPVIKAFFDWFGTTGLPLSATPSTTQEQSGKVSGQVGNQGNQNPGANLTSGFGTFTTGTAQTPKAGGPS